ncbi:MAG: hypothetical protein JNM52_04885, partial [Betaproteobacteria bacterium]|nr:hypothetical protein [Betaproteobacteria bacterium]
LGSTLMRELMVCARAAGYAQIEGVVLKNNLTMLKLAGTLGFTISPSTEDMNTVVVSLLFS